MLPRPPITAPTKAMSTIDSPLDQLTLVRVAKNKMATIAAIVPEITNAAAMTRFDLIPTSAAIPTSSVEARS